MGRSYQFLETDQEDCPSYLKIGNHHTLGSISNDMVPCPTEVTALTIDSWCLLASIIASSVLMLPLPGSHKHGSKKSTTGSKKKVK